MKRRREHRRITRIVPVIALSVVAAGCTWSGDGHRGAATSAAPAPTASSGAAVATASCPSGPPQTPGWSQAAALPGISPEGIAFVDPCTGILVGLDLGEGRLHERQDIVPCFAAAAWTDDGGASIHFVSLPKGVRALLALTATDRAHAWAAGAGASCQQHGAIVQTSDGGRTWAAETVPPGTPRLTAIDFPDARHGWALGEGTLLATHDGGRSWRRALPPAGVKSLAAVWFLDRDVGWLLATTATGATVESTVDAGAHWSSAPVATGSVVPVAMRFLDASTGWVAVTSVTARGSRAIVMETTDGGRSWHPLPIPSVEAVRGMWFATSELGWLSADTLEAGEILGTTDGGSTWTVQRRSADLPAGPLAFVGASLGWMAGDGALFSSPNGGGPPRPATP